MNKNDMLSSSVVCKVSFMFRTLFVIVGQLIPKLVGS
jgi:hypothetical protein